MDCCFGSLNRSIPFSPEEHAVIKSKEQTLINVQVPFIDEIPRLVIIKILDKNVQNTMMLELKFTQNLATLYVTNNGLETMIFDPVKC